MSGAEDSVPRRRSRRMAVVVPSFNHARFIGETLRSVLAQTHVDLELHVLDDESTDGSPAAIERVLSEAPAGMRCELRTRGNRGCSATRNELITGVRAEWLAILNSDDLLVPTRLERMLREVPETGHHFGFSAVEFLFGEGISDEEAWREFYPGCSSRNPSWTLACIGRTRGDAWNTSEPRRCRKTGVDTLPRWRRGVPTRWPPFFGCGGGAYGCSCGWSAGRSTSNPSPPCSRATGSPGPSGAIDSQTMSFLRISTRRRCRPCWSPVSGPVRRVRSTPWISPCCSIGAPITGRPSGPDSKRSADRRGLVD